MFQVPYPQIAWVRRRIAGRASAGDRAQAALDPGIIAWLEAPLGGAPLAEGFEPRAVVPYGVARTAAGAILGPIAAGGGAWIARFVDIVWSAEAEPADAIVGDAELLTIDPKIARFAIGARTAGGRPLLSGELRLAATPVAPLEFAQKAAKRGASILASIDAPRALALGRSAWVTATVVNIFDARAAFVVSATPPFGAGLSLDGDAEVQLSLSPGETRRVQFRVRADRPDEVNLGRPWRLGVTVAAGAAHERGEVAIAVPDLDPGRVLYVLTEDCETFDGGPKTGDYGDWSVLGNANNFMDPEDYRVQMIAKPDRMNAIADRHGARWTHFWCATQRFAAAWAEDRSSTGAWRRILADLDESVRRGAAGHEYAPHIHFDYEPDSARPPQPRLLYDAATDGLLPNEYYDPESNPRHHWHDWDGAGRGGVNLKALGDLNTVDSKAGSLRKTQRFLSQLTANQRHAMVARSGGFDFGIEPADQCISTEAFEQNGLAGNSDAVAPNGRAPRGNAMYFCQAGDRLREIQALDEARLVQLCVTFETDFQDASVVNRWFAAAHEAAKGSGVRVLMVMTHAMFMRGLPDPFRSLDGGSFSALDEHLGWVRASYPAVEFATATEALIEYLDYYSPRTRAYVEPAVCDADSAAGRYVYAVRVLGRGIRIDAVRPTTVRVIAPPLFDAHQVERLRLFDGDAVLAELGDFDARVLPSIEATLTARPASLRLQVDVKPASAAEIAACFRWPMTFVDPAEPRRPPLLALRRPSGSFSTDALRILMHPIAGHDEPLGRRLHPLGAFAMGVALASAKQRDPRAAVRRLRLRWRRPIELGAILTATPASAGTGDGGHAMTIEDETGTTLADARVWLESPP